MKRLILISILSVLGLFVVNAQTSWYNSSEYAIKYTGYNWSSWYKCNIPIKFDLNYDMVVIYSNMTQIYEIFEDLGSSEDSKGGKQQSYRVIDQDGDIGVLRLRIDPYGYSQIYIDFADFSWVYGKVEKQLFLSSKGF